MHDLAISQFYCLSLHDALPISIDTFAFCTHASSALRRIHAEPGNLLRANSADGPCTDQRSEEHTSELQSRGHLVCRLLLQKKKKKLLCSHILYSLHISEEHTYK